MWQQVHQDWPVDDSANGCSTSTTNNGDDGDSRKYIRAKPYKTRGGAISPPIVAITTTKYTTSGNQKQTALDISRSR